MRRARSVLATTAAAFALLATFVAPLSAAADGHGAAAPIVYEHMQVPQGQPHPFPRNSFGVAAGDDRSFFLFGGAFEHFKGDTPLYEHYGDLWRFSWDDGLEARWELVHGCDPDDVVCTGRPCAPAVEDGCDGQLSSPSSRAFPSMVELVDPGGRRFLALFGGNWFTKTFQSVPRPDSFWLYDVEAGTWEDLTPPPGVGPSPRAGPVGVADGGRFYVFAGIDAALETFNDLWMFDLATRAWTLLSPHDPDSGPEPRFAAHGTVVSVQDTARLVVYGGEIVEAATLTFDTPDDTWEFVFDDGSWTKLMPVEGVPAENITPTRNYAAVAGNADGDRLVLQGGDIEGGSDGCGALFFEDTTNEVWVYDRLANRWQQRPIEGLEPPGAKRHGGVRVGDHMYVMGGWEFVCDEDGVGPGQVFNTEVYRFGLDGGPVPADVADPPGAPGVVPAPASLPATGGGVAVGSLLIALLAAVVRQMRRS